MQQQQERERQAPQEDAAGSTGMDVDGEAAPPPLHRAGMVQRELVDWYIGKQLQR